MIFHEFSRKIILKVQQHPIVHTYSHKPLPVIVFPFFPSPNPDSLNALLWIFALKLSDATITLSLSLCLSDAMDFHQQPVAIFC